MLFRLAEYCIYHMITVMSDALGLIDSRIEVSLCGCSCVVTGAVVFDIVLHNVFTLTLLYN